VRARDKRLRLRKQTFGLRGLPTNQASSTFKSDMPCSMPAFQGARPAQRPTKSPVGICFDPSAIPGPVSTIFDTPTVARRPCRQCKTLIRRRRYNLRQSFYTYTSSKSTDRPEINGRLHASAVLEQDHSHEIFLTIMASLFISTFAKSGSLSKLGHIHLILSMITF
jgi:hypothetical protein